MARILGFLVIGVAACLGGVAHAQALLGPAPYLSQADSPFASLITSGVVVLEDFEDNALNVPFVSASAGAPTGPGGLTDSVDADDGTIDGSGTNGRSMFHSPGSAGITFTFDSSAPGGLPTHAGIVWTDGEGTTSFEAFGPGGASLGVVGPVALAHATFLGTTAEDRFFGVINASGISAIRISNTQGGIEVDHLQFGGSSLAPPQAPADIPVLGPLGLLGMAALLAIAGVVGVRRRR